MFGAADASESRATSELVFRDVPSTVSPWIKTGFKLEAAREYY
jgi:hypothetical protein